MNQKHIVVYNGGAAGDLITAMLDYRGAHITDEGRVRHDPNREALKKPHIFGTDLHKDMYLTQAFGYYHSLPSHDIRYHIDRNHDFIGVVVLTRKAALWAAKRFSDLHPESVWKEMQAAAGVKDVDGYAQMMLDFSNLVAEHTRNVLSLEDILQGNAIKALESITGEPVSEIGQEFYKQWLLHNTQWQQLQ